MNKNSEKKNKLLRINKFLISTGVNGPGRRFVIWFQGCSIRCSGCINPDLWDEKGGLIMDVNEVLSRIKMAEEIEGVTFTGGEPLMQSEALLELCKKIKKMGLSILCYSGYTYEEIINDKVAGGKELIRYFDILIDGPYNEEEKASLIWRGSKNQRVYFLTERYRHLEPFVLQEGKREVEMLIGSDDLFITGFFDLELWERMKKKLS